MENDYLLSKIASGELTVGVLRCLECGYVWRAVYPVGVKSVLCDHCGTGVCEAVKTTPRYLWVMTTIALSAGGLAVVLGAVGAALMFDGLQEKFDWPSAMIALGVSALIIASGFGMFCFGAVVTWAYLSSPLDVSATELSGEFFLDDEDDDDA